MSTMIRAASLRGFAPLVRRLGGDPIALLNRSGISPALLATEDGLVSITAHDQMLDAAAAELHCPDLGLRLAGGQDLSVLGPLALAIEASGTVAEALQCASKFMFVHSPALSVAVEPDPLGEPGAVALTYRKDLRFSPYSPQAMELGIGLFHRVTLALVRDLSGLLSVELPHRPISPLERYHEFFDSPVRFGATAGALRIDQKVLDQRFAGADEAIRAVALDYLRRRHREPGLTTSDKVLQVVAGRLGTASCDLRAVARLLMISPRTLQRRLEEEDTTYGLLLDQARRAAAIRYITSTDLPLIQVAALVGFAEQSALSRAVRRWQGISPRELRRVGAVGAG